MKKKKLVFGTLGSGPPSIPVAWLLSGGPLADPFSTLFCRFTRKPVPNLFCLPIDGRLPLSLPSVPENTFTKSWFQVSADRPSFWCA